MSIRLAEWPEFLEFVHTGTFGSGERLDRLRLGAQQGVHETRGKPLLIRFLFSSFTQDDHAQRIDFLATVITHPFFLQRIVAMVGIPREDAKTALIGAHVRGCEAEVFDTREDAVRWFGQGERHSLTPAFGRKRSLGPSRQLRTGA